MGGQIVGGDEGSNKDVYKAKTERKLLLNDWERKDDQAGRCDDADCVADDSKGIDCPAQHAEGVQTTVGN